MSDPMRESVSSLSTVATLGRGVEAAPALRSGFGLTLLFAMLGAAGGLDAAREKSMERERAKRALDAIKRILL